MVEVIARGRSLSTPVAAIIALSGVGLASLANSQGGEAGLAGSVGSTSFGRARPALRCSHRKPPQTEEPAMSDVRPPLPPFTAETAAQKVRAAEDGWNSRDPQRVSLAYSPDSVWRNRSTFVRGRERIVEFLSGKWQREQEYRLIKELWAFTGNRIAVRFAYEWHDDSGNWFRSYGNENWAFDEQGLMYERHASINDLPIREDQRLFRWPLGRRPDNHPSLGELGL
ncbi:hypothetical protein ALP65_03994 [Pseudomonas aeruginosa]|uniref:DUF1348 domain-containing protein n=7 Tax=Pseudomonas TaxID=286 RepID=A0A3M5DEI1_PSEAI|nr:hypothetical protein ALP65_03994 [Pseudomonas aeruginosa]